MALCVNPAWVKMRRIQNRTKLSLIKLFKTRNFPFTAENPFYNQKNSKSGKRHFGKVAYLLGKSSNWIMTFSTFWIFLIIKWVFGRKGKFLVLKSFISESFVRFWIRRIFTHAGGHMLDLHRRPSWNVFFISLGSLVLFKDSKTMVRFFGRQNFELFQCSAEGWKLHGRTQNPEFWILWVFNAA